MGCHLGWHFAVGCPLRGGRGVFIQKHQKQLRKKKTFHITMAKGETGQCCYDEITARDVFLFL
jgi:hypothetical protein